MGHEEQVKIAFCHTILRMKREKGKVKSTLNIFI